MAIMRKGTTHLLAIQMPAALDLWEATLQLSCPWNLHKEYATELQHVTSSEVNTRTR